MKKEEDLNKLLKEWQRRLFLTDWKIILKKDVKPCDFVNQNACGECDFEESTKSAVIRILDKRDYSKNWSLPYDGEKTLVHELLHLKFSLLDGSDNAIQNRIVHQLVDELSVVLVDAKRQLSGGKK